MFIFRGLIIVVVLLYCIIIVVDVLVFASLYNLLQCMYDIYICYYRYVYIK